MENIGLGIAIVIVAALLQGSFMVPMAYVRTWKWENSWAVFTLLGMFVFNWILAIWTIPSLGSVYSSVPMTAILIQVLFGLLWGIGAVCFGLGMAAVGFALGYAVIMGLVLGLGAFIPLALLQPTEIATPKGMLILLGLAVVLVGIAVCGRAGIRKEREQGTRAGEITRTSTLSIGAGLLVCLLAGIFSCFPNVGFAFSKPLVNAATRLGAEERWVGNAVWAILFTFGGLVNLAYCGYLFQKNRSLALFGNQGLVRNVLLVALMAAMWIGSFALYGLGAQFMGEWGPVVGWSVFIALSIGVASLWGIAQGEWRDTSSATRRWMFTGLAVIAAAILVLAFASAR